MIPLSRLAKIKELVAIHVMGYGEPVKVRPHGVKDQWMVAFKHSPASKLGNYNCYYTEDGTKVSCGQPFHIHLPSNYPTDIAAAWTVLQKVLAGEHAETFAWQLWWKIDGQHHDTYFQIVLAALRYLTPKTICELALKAYGVELPPEEEER